MMLKPSPLQLLSPLKLRESNFSKTKEICLGLSALCSNRAFCPIGAGRQEKGMLIIMLNVAVVMGRLVADPEIRHTPSDVAVTSFTLAVDRSYVKSGSERQADFIDIVAWRNTAEFVCKYFKKGQMMAVHGSIQTRTYTDNNGNKRKAFEIVADDVNFADSKRDSAGGAGDYQQRPAGDYQQRPAAFSEPAPAYSSGSSGDFEEVIGDDDLPF